MLRSGMGRTQVEQREPPPPPIRVLAQHPPDCVALLLRSTFSLSSFSPPRSLLHPPLPLSPSLSLSPRAIHWPPRPPTLLHAPS